MVQAVPLFADLSERVENPTLRTLSCGLGTQSTALVLAAAYGLVGPAPDVAIWSDPGGESHKIRQHLAMLRYHCPFPIIDTSAGNLEAELLAHFAAGTRTSAIPWKIIGPDGKKGQAMRQCTSDKKIRPVRRATRALLGVQPRCRVPKGVVVEQWMGISTDEVERVASSTVGYIVNRYPLLELGWSKIDCRNFVDALFPYYPLYETACVFCPFRNNARWRQVRADPIDWARAVAIDEAARSSSHSRMRGTLYLHHSRVPLAEADLDDDSDQGEGMRNECLGYCGV